MKILSKSIFIVLLLSIALFGSSCLYTEDPGPIQETSRDYSIVDFDRLEMGSAFHVSVQQGDHFEVSARGDIRNIDDLEVYKNGNTLVIRFDDNHNRHHTTYIDIVMPSLNTAKFSGASQSTITGFESDNEIYMNLSGASVSQIDLTAHELHVSLSGASTLTARGDGDEISADLSGASTLKAFDYVVDDADINASGASKANVSVGQHLRAVANGASVVRYRGNPSVDASSSGASTIKPD